MPAGDHVGSTRTVDKNDIQIRHFQLSDLDQVVALEQAKWDPDQAANAPAEWAGS